MIYRIAILIVAGLFVINTNSYAQSARELSDTARYYYEQGNYQEAVRLLEKSIQLEPLAESYYALGLCHVQIGALDKASAAFQRAATADKYFVKGLYQLAQIYSDTRLVHYDLDAALEVLKKAIAIDPTHVEAQFKLGEIYFIKGTIGINTTHEQMRQFQKKAEKALLRALQLNPQLADAHNYLGQLYGTWGQHNSAILQFQKAVQLNPQHNEAWLYLGMDCYRLGLLAESVRALENAQRSQYEHIRQAATNMLTKVRAAQAGKN